MRGRLLGRLGTWGRFGKLKCRVNRDPLFFFFGGNELF